MSKTNYHKSSSPYPEWNVKKFEEKLEKEVKHRKNLISYSTNNFENNTNEGSKVSSFQLDETNEGMLQDSSGIYKQFLLIGVPPTVENSQDPNVKPTVLIAYPPFEYQNMPVNKIIEHCMPTGQNRAFLSRNTNSPIQDEFVFQFGRSFSSEDKPIYGVCVHVSTKDTSPPFYGSKKDKDRVFCFCLMTKIPVFSAHFSFLTCLALWTVGHVRHLHKYDNIIRVNLPPGEPIEDLDLVDQIGHHPSITVPVSFQNEIASYFISSITAKPEKLSRASNTFMKGYVDKKIEKMNNKHHNFRYDDEDCSIELKFPPEKDINENSICWASLDTLFSVLSPSDILTIISGLLLDRQVLIIGSRLQEVSMAVWALTSIIRPFKFAGTIIPVLPTMSENYLGLLQLPTPFLFGVPRCNELKSVTFLETAVFVDLDKQNVPPIENLPPYPNSKYVESELMKFLNTVRNSHEVNEYGFPPIYFKTLHHKYSFSSSSCSKILEIVSSPFHSSLYGNYICGFFVTDMSASPEGVTVFNEELFLSQIHSMVSEDPAELYGAVVQPSGRERGKDKEKRIKDEMDFWNDIIQSQTFQMYIEERMQDFMELKYRTLIESNAQKNKANEKNENKEISSSESEKVDNKKEQSKSDEKLTSIEKLTEIKESEKLRRRSNTEKKEPVEKNIRSAIKKASLITHISDDEVKAPKSVPLHRVRVNRTRKVQINHPKRIKSLKNVLFDLPTPSQSKADLNKEENSAKSDTEGNDNLPLSSQKITKSSTVAILKTTFYSDDEYEVEDERKQMRKLYPSPIGESDDSEENHDDDVKHSKSQSKRRGSVKKVDKDDENSSDNDNRNSKRRKSSSNAEKSDNENVNINSKKRKSKANKSDSDKSDEKERPKSRSNSKKKSVSNPEKVENSRKRRKTVSNTEKSDSEDVNIKKSSKKKKSNEDKDDDNKKASSKKKVNSNDDKSDSEDFNTNNVRRRSSTIISQNEGDNDKSKSLKKQKSSEYKLKKTLQSNHSKNSIKNVDNEEEETKKSKPKRKSSHSKRPIPLGGEGHIVSSNEKMIPKKTKRISNEDENEKKKHKQLPEKTDSSNRIQRRSSITMNSKSPKLPKDDSQKKKIQIQFDSSTDYDSYSESSDSFNPNVFYQNEEIDRSSTGDED